MNYVISKEATKDLENVWLYTFENWSVDQADRYLNLLFDEFEYLCLKPNSGYDFGNIRKGYFRCKVKSHFVFYKIKGNELEIIRVLHEMMDIDNHLMQ